MENEIRARLMVLMSDRIKRLDISPDELGSNFDLVKSGFVNSLEFVELVTTLEKEFNCEIDFETAIEKNNLTTIGGLIKSFEEQKNG